MILIDFDGTITDVWPRFYSVFTELLGLTDVSLEQYREVKQKSRRDADVAAYFGKELPEEYFSRKKDMLEEKAFLLKDTLYFYPETINGWLVKGTRILTKRRKPDCFFWQLDRLGIQPMAYVVTDLSKKEWIERNTDQRTKTIIIGDSEAEIQAGELPNVEAWLVGYGLTSREHFDSYHIPYRYFDTPGQLQQAITETITSLCNSGI